MADYSLIDLHTHTTHSREPLCDDTVSEVLSEAQEVAERTGKDALVAITDHNTITGVIEARQLLKTGKFDKVKLLSGVEFTVDMSEINGIFGGARVFGNMHILAYGFDENNPDLIEFSKKYQSGKRGNIKYSELVNLVKNAGGYLVVAHPGLIRVFPKNVYYYTGKDHADELSDIAANAKKNKTILNHIPNGQALLRVLFERLKKLSGGIMVGMERFHPDNYYRSFDYQIDKICSEQGLVQTAGSDFHGYHLHTNYSVGNVFTKEFQEFYKDTLQDSQIYKNGLYLSALPNLNILTGNPNDKSSEIKMVTAGGEGVTYDQYGAVRGAYREVEKENYARKKENEEAARNNNNNNSNKNNNKKKKKHGKKRHRMYNMDQPSR